MTLDAACFEHRYESMRINHKEWQIWGMTFSRSSGAGNTAFFSPLKSSSYQGLSLHALISLCLYLSGLSSLILTHFYGFREACISNIKDILLSVHKFLHDKSSVKPTHTALV